MDFFRPGFFEHADQVFHRRTAHDRVIDEDNAFSPDSRFQNIKLDTDAIFAFFLGRFDEGSADFSGVDAKGKWHDTAVQEVLPVEVLTVDDRMEHCEGVKPVTVGEHEALKGIPTDWPEVLGYNKVIAKPEAEVPVTVEGDPFIAFASYGKGRSGVVTTDCAPHWAPPEFCEWEYYNKLWQNIADWLIQK